ncbi:MAG: pyrimidine reductase family protein [Microthrixaceae bacterium]
MQRLWPDPAPVDDVEALVAGELRPVPSTRPWLLVNMVTSLDGAVTVDERSGGLARPADKQLFIALRSVADVILVGAGTVRAEGYGPPRPTAATRAARIARGQAETPTLVIVSRSLDLDPSAPRFTEAEARPIVITCAEPADRPLEDLREVADVIVTGSATVDLPAAMTELYARGVRTVTCEGGPHLNGDLLVADLIDEWALTLSPLLVGGDARRATTGPLPEPAALHLDRLLEGDGLLLGRWLRDR